MNVMIIIILFLFEFIYLLLNFHTQINNKIFPFFFFIYLFYNLFNIARVSEVKRSFEKIPPYTNAKSTFLLTFEKLLFRKT